MPYKNAKNIEKINPQSSQSLKVCPFGAHILSWIKDGQEVLFVSKNSSFDESAPIRGGVPVIFPQFGGFGNMMNHGFARIEKWDLIAKNDKKIVFGLAKNIHNESLWGFDFEAQLEITLTDSLLINLKIKNTDSKDFTFTTALHTYFRVSNIERVIVKGLQGFSYIDDLDDGKVKVEQSKAITIDQEVDRVYLDSKHQEICDLLMGRNIKIESNGFNDAVLWNPWVDKSKIMTDFGDEEYKEMLCIEAATIDKPITLEAGRTWQGYQKISITPIK